jgi:hypothetical protein
MYIAAALETTGRLRPAVLALHAAIAAKAEAWDGIVKIGRTHMQDATPLTLGQEWSGYAAMLGEDVERLEDALKGVYRPALGCPDRRLRAASRPSGARGRCPGGNPRWRRSRDGHAPGPQSRPPRRRGRNGPGRGFSPQQSHAPW